MGRGGGGEGLGARLWGRLGPGGCPSQGFLQGQSPRMCVCVPVHVEASGRMEVERLMHLKDLAPAGVGGACGWGGSGGRSLGLFSEGLPLVGRGPTLWG